MCERAAAAMTLPELTRVILTSPIQHGDTVVPAGACGTVMAIYAGGNACEVEFDEPHHAVLTVSVVDVRAQGTAQVVLAAMTIDSGIAPDTLTQRYVRLHKLFQEAAAIRLRLREIAAERKALNAECDELEAIPDAQ
jgi:hypothetical protein